MRGKNVYRELRQCRWQEGKRQESDWGKAGVRLAKGRWGLKQVERARDERQVAKGRKGKQHAPCAAR